jgi:hypothetical protein
VGFLLSSFLVFFKRPDSLFIRVWAIVLPRLFAIVPLIWGLRRASGTTVIWFFVVFVIVMYVLFHHDYVEGRGRFVDGERISSRKVSTNHGTGM